mmetsp:Transcript_238/g.585  ORF Transcript_238/g.585 Transcript_238/m.585 type:complete len:267 (+) Transcript_238:298-1098(+)|eukprot:CAMPEP_0171488090 /NCGR_PEP_ID=MMETSP0958-20121227/2015_1 /TAXON_ID=87120 /ORGANISM="Aurantiochytrium limacinum, Strain ATCCMYA-1381" /LENGTH=266 /DNA_ID=CAMNT_0012021167 /DNA_START=290 /DNA_END=1090 /DNA_ORIENTATION=+
MSEMESRIEEAAAPAKVVLVFDYDWSLINENSDTYIFKQLAPEIHDWLREQSSSRPGDWTAVVDDSLLKMQVETTVGIPEIQNCLENVPVLDGMLDAVREVGESDLGSVHIVSDANDFFIRVFLEKNGLAGLVDSVQTNRAYHDEAGHLRVAPFVDPADPHPCDLCPKNLCKGVVLDKLELLAPDSRVVYVGDGGGDFCPGLRLRAQDWLLVRQDDGYPSALGLSKRIRKNQEHRPVTAQLRTWTKGSEVTQIVREALALARRAHV